MRKMEPHRLRVIIAKMNSAPPPALPFLFVLLAVCPCLCFLLRFGRDTGGNHPSCVAVQRRDLLHRLSNCLLHRLTLPMIMVAAAMTATPTPRPMSLCLLVHVVTPIAGERDE